MGAENTQTGPTSCTAKGFAETQSGGLAPRLERCTENSYNSKVFNRLAIGLFLLAAQEARSPIPDEPTQKKANAELHEIFKAEYAGRDRDARRTLSERLIAESGQTSSAETRYVMLAEARDLAADAGDLATALKAVSLIAAQYDLKSVSAPALKLEMLGRARRALKGPDEISALGQALCDVAREAIDAADYDTARAAAREGTAAAGTARRADELLKEADALKKDFEGIQKVELGLSVNADDPEANLKFGRYLCFAKSDWEKGLPLLAKGSDGALAAVARKEMAKPEAVEARIEVGDDWAALAGKMRAPHFKQRYVQRAGSWYQRALESSDGLQRLKIQKRIDSLPAEKSPLVDLFRLVDLKADVLGAGWQLENGEFLVNGPQGLGPRLVLPYAVPEEYDLLLTVQPRAPGRPMLILGIVAGSTRFRVDVGWQMALRMVDGTYGLPNGKACLDAGKPSQVLVSVRRTEFRIEVDGKEMIAWKEYARLSSDAWWDGVKPGVPFISAWGCTLSVKQIKIRPVSGPGRLLR